MSIEIRPLGVACNLACTYCYQEPQRVTNNKKPKYDLDKIIAEIEKTGQEFHLFGGEALLVPKKDLEILFEYGYKKFGSNGIQTNGTLIDKDHIDLFKKYNVYVGVSIDGPNELNGLRKVRKKEENEEATLQSTQQIMENILLLKQNNIDTSIIITLHRLNGTGENLERLMHFIRWLGDSGITSGNIHALEVDKTMPDQEIHVLDQTENTHAFLTLAKFFKEDRNKDLNWNPFRDYENALVREDFESLTCYLNRCDPMNTQAVYGVEGDGGLSNCGRTNKEGIEWYKTEETYSERYLSLYNTPHELDGCNGCSYFMLCSGGCPGEAIDGDFRNKTIHCQTYKAIYAFYENEAEKSGLVPWTKRPERKMFEHAMMEELVNGRYTNVGRLKNKPSQMIVVPVGGGEVV